MCGRALAAERRCRPVAGVRDVVAEGGGGGGGVGWGGEGRGWFEGEHPRFGWDGVRMECVQTAPGSRSWGAPLSPYLRPSPPRPPPPHTHTSLEASTSSTTDVSVRTDCAWFQVMGCGMPPVNQGRSGAAGAGLPAAASLAARRACSWAHWSMYCRGRGQVWKSVRGEGHVQMGILIDVLPRSGV